METPPINFVTIDQVKENIQQWRQLTLDQYSHVIQLINNSIMKSSLVGETYCDVALDGFGVDDQAFNIIADAFTRNGFEVDYSSKNQSILVYTTNWNAIVTAKRKLYNQVMSISWEAAIT